MQTPEDTVEAPSDRSLTPLDSGDIIPGVDTPVTAGGTGWKRLRPLDRVLVLTLVPLWCVCFGLHLVVGFSGGIVESPLPWHFVPAVGEEAYPTVALSEGPDMAVGDLVLRVGDQDLRGVTSMAGLLAAHFEQADEDRHFYQLSHEGVPFEIEVEIRRLPMWWASIPFSLGMLLVGLLVLLRAPSWPLSRLLFGLCFAIAFSQTSFYGLGMHPAATYASLAMETLTTPLVAVFTIRWACLFPDRRPPLKLWETLLSWFFGFGSALLYLATFWFYWSQWFPSDWSGFIITHSVVFLWALTLRYRRTDLLGRRQIKWILYGFYLGVAPTTFVVVLAPLMEIPAREFWVVLQAASLFSAAIPIGILVAVFGYRFLDVDPLVSATASYSILSIGVVVGILALIPTIAGAAGTALGVDHGSAQFALSVVFAATAFPIHRSLRPRIDRLFFPERHSLEQGIEGLLAELSNLEDPRSITVRTGERLLALLQPDSVVVYAVVGSAFEPTFVHGRAVPPAIERASPLVATLHERSSPLASNRFSQRDRLEQLSAFDRATLETLGASVVLPVQGRSELAAFLCLGPKHSGDIYTSNELALLTAVADKVSSELVRFDEAKILSESRAMQEELRRYVPAAVARGLEGGGGLEPRERAVSILFVDIRGYTAYAESRRAHEIFSTVNSYTQTVSSIVKEFGGSVVEFNGDGMMAVFGAPQPLPDKERAALSAGREIFAAVASIAGPNTQPGEISVAVGIASGSAFVGNIQSADRLIWTALGNTTNLAARLQALARDLDAAMVIDLATQRGAGELATDFEIREQIRIRGRDKLEDVYLLPLVS